MPSARRDWNPIMTNPRMVPPGTRALLGHLFAALLRVSGFSAAALLLTVPEVFRIF